MNVANNISFEQDVEPKHEGRGVVFNQFYGKTPSLLAGVEVNSQDDDFEKVWVSGISGEELKQRMYKRIDKWKWKER